MKEVNREPHQLIQEATPNNSRFIIFLDNLELYRQLVWRLTSPACCRLVSEKLALKLGDGKVSEAVDNLASH